MIGRLGIATAALLLIAALVAAPASAQEPRASLPDIEDEVMCPICGTLLEESQSPQAERERELIRRLIDEGKDKEQIKDELVTEYGPNVLATPGGSGFDLVAWLVPGVGLILAGLAIALTLRRVRRGGDGPAAGPPELSPQDQRRIDADLADFDA
jgi:cytochrome c-type biogenesis protein CcmH